MDGFSVCIDIAGEIPPYLLRPNSFEICFGEKKIGKSLILDNSAIKEEKTIDFVVPADAQNITINIYRGKKIFRQQIIPARGKTRIKLKTTELLKWLLIGKQEKAEIVVDCGNREIRKSIKISRSSFGIMQDRDKSAKSLDPLYNNIALSLKKGKPIVATVNVALWDASFDPFGKWNGDSRADGSNPDGNLYWGFGWGIFSFFNRRGSGWKLALRRKDKEGRDRLAVFSRKFSPNQFWRKKGVTKPFEMYAVFNVYLTSKIVDANTGFVADLFEDRPKQIILDNGRNIQAGSSSHIVGYIGHMHKKSIEAIHYQRFSQKPRQMAPKGVFVASCFSAEKYSTYTLGSDAFGLFYTKGKMAPEGYIPNALFEAVARGEDGTGVGRNAALAYQRHQKLTYCPGRAFIGSASTGIKEYSKPLEGDPDQDGIPNFLDPEPSVGNKNSVKDGILTVTTSSGKTIKIKLDSGSLAGQFFEYLHHWF